jgi:mono/diheme cytochrome c family protein
MRKAMSLGILAGALLGFTGKSFAVETLEIKVKQIFERSCYGCHGKPDRKVYGNFDYLLDHKQLIAKDKENSILKNIGERILDAENNNDGDAEGQANIQQMKMALE